MAPRLHLEAGAQDQPQPEAQTQTQTQPEAQTQPDPDEANAHSAQEADSEPEREPAGGWVVPRSVKPLARADSLDVEASQLKGWSPHHSTLTTAVILRLAYQSIGVVYGDVGTSPLYVYETAFPNGLTHSERDKQNLLGALSLIIYTLTLSPLFKYVTIVLRANDNGNGGTFALYSLICRHAKVSLVGNQNYEDRELSTYSLTLPSRRRKIAGWLKARLEGSLLLKNLLLILVCLGTSLIIGDGTLTPSISVLSAVSGLQVNKSTNVSQTVVVGITVVILIMLFTLQQKGTDKVGFLFAPAVCTWFLTNSLIGLYNIVKHDPSILKAFNPQYIYYYFRNNKADGWIHLGGIVLAITGTEAMFADLAHFSVPSIRIAFAGFVYPSLLLTYCGQAAYLMKHPEDVSKTFYKSIPPSVYWPMFAVATAAAIIASQAMISAVYSILSQSMAMSCFPRVKIIHTSKRFHGQIYIPEINWLLMILCITITLGFRDTSTIGNAYGIAVVGVFVITTILVTLIMLLIWQVNVLLAMLFFFGVGSVEVVYLSAVLYKVPQGGWVPLVFAVVFLTIQYTWQYVQVNKYRYEMNNKLSLDWVVGLGSNLGVVRVPGIALVYTELAQGVPAIFSHLITNLPAIHSTVVFVCIKHLPLAHVPEEERILIRRLGPKEYRMYRCAVRYGYVDAETETTMDFEQRLVQGLSDFLQMELPEADAGGQSNGRDRLQLGHLSETESADSRRKNSTSSTSDRSEAIVPGSRQGSADRLPGVDVARELGFLQQAKQAGVVYLLGSVDLQADPSSSVLRKFVIDSLFAFLRRNSRDSSFALHIPHNRLLRVGVTNQI